MFQWPPSFPALAPPPDPPGGWGAWLAGAAALAAVVLLLAAVALVRALRRSDAPEPSPPAPSPPGESPAAADRPRPVRGELIAGGAARVDARPDYRPDYRTDGKPGGRDPRPPGLPPGEGHARRLRRVRAVADFLDNSLKIPGVGYPIGWDSVIGLVPGAGDAVTGALAVWIILQARALGVPKRKLLRMLANAGVDAAGGALPGVGDLFDVAFKANRRNLRLIETHLAEVPRKVR